MTREEREFVGLIRKAADGSMDHYIYINGMKSSFTGDTSAEYIPGINILFER